MDQDAIRAKALDYVAKEGDANFRAEVEALLKAEDWKELEDRFYRDLEFGTGGLRGVIGGGYNRMNSLVVGRATQGLCDYLRQALPGKSPLGLHRLRLAPLFAGVLRDHRAGLRGQRRQGLSLQQPRPTPELSFAIRRLKADTGIVVTASHNPPKYNGYKAYWNDGAQVTPPHDEGIIRMVEAVKEVKSISKEEAVKKGLFVAHRQGDRRSLRRDGQVQAPQARSHQGDGGRG
jgi:phosphoglucomutase